MKKNLVKVRRVRALSKHRLKVCFEDGVAGIVDLSDRLFGPVFAPLKDPRLFARVTVDAFGVVAWPNGADLAPDALYEALRKSPLSTKVRT